MYIEKAQKGKYINITKNKYRQTPNSKLDNIFLLGGSTAFGYGVPDNKTISYYFNELNKSSKTMRNYGHGGFYTTLEVRHLIDLLASGQKPKKVIFFHGLNEGKKLPYNENLLTHLYETYNYNLFKFFSIGISNNFVVQRLIRLKADPKKDTFSKWSDWYEEYLRNLQIIQALSKAFGFDVYVFLQPVPGYNNDFFPHKFSQELNNQFVINQTNKYKFIKTKEAEINSIVHYCDISDILSNFKGTPFVDGTHYSPKVNLLIANKISNFINKNKCK